MGYNFPWTNLHDLNLDWIMRQLKRIDELQSTVNHFIQQIPSRLSQLVNDTGFINAAQAAAAAPVQSVNEHTGDVTITDIMTRRANQATAYPTTSGAWSVASNIFSNLTAASYYGILTIENNGSYQRHIFNNMSGQVFVGWTDNANTTEPATWSSLTEMPEALYFCDYNVTTNAQIEAALAANKIPVLLYSDTLYVFDRRVSTTNHYFCAVHSTSSSSNYYYARCNSNAWTSGSGTLARLASPTFTGTPKAPTASAGDNTTQLATTAFVQQEISNAGIPSASSATPIVNGTGAAGSSTAYARGDHVHPTDTTRAPVASPTFTGTPAAPTAGTGTSTTQIATTAFVQQELDSTTKTTITSAMLSNKSSKVTFLQGAIVKHHKIVDFNIAFSVSTALTNGEKLFTIASAPSPQDYVWLPVYSASNLNLAGTYVVKNANGGLDVFANGAISVHVWYTGQTTYISE